jgi:hypothetical protein
MGEVAERLGSLESMQTLSRIPDTVPDELVADYIRSSK